MLGKLAGSFGRKTSPAVESRAPRAAIHLSEVVSSLSYALDLTEGQPSGHAARSCIIGMHIGQALRLPTEQLSSLFYALLLKDLGCSSNAARMCTLFQSDDRTTKCDVKTVNWRSVIESAKFVASHVSPEQSLMQKAARFFSIALGGGKINKELFQMRCERGASIARKLHLPEEAALAIRSLDEHWDGGGYPSGLKGDQIPLLARILGISQTVEVFWQKGGMASAADVARERSGTWFDPELSKVFLTLAGSESLLHALSSDNPADVAAALEPDELTVPVSTEALDRLASGFGEVVDAKSPWTYAHSAGVAEVAVGIGKVLDLPVRRLQTLRRAALLHDIGKLGVSNLILDKPGKLTPEELVAMRRHPQFTFDILAHVKLFDSFALMSSSHHERLDGRGYHQALPGAALTLEAKILAVADMYEALAAKRPYRKDLSKEDVFTIINKDRGVGLCPTTVDALTTFIQRSKFVPIKLAA